MKSNFFHKLGRPPSQCSRFVFLQLGDVSRFKLLPLQGPPTIQSSKLEFSEEQNPPTTRSGINLNDISYKGVPFTFPGAGLRRHRKWSHFSSGAGLRREKKVCPHQKTPTLGAKKHPAPKVRRKKIGFLDTQTKQKSLRKFSHFEGAKIQKK